MHSAAPADNGAFAERAARHILLAIDDEMLRACASAHLIRHGYVTSTAACGEMPDKVWQVPGVDCLIVDDAGCAGNSTSLCSSVREVSASIPIIVLGSLHDTEARIDALEAGADDYVLKPVDTRALMARIKAVLRRVTRERKGPALAGTCGYSFDGCRLDVLSHTLQHADGSIHTLNATDFRLLEALLKNAGKVIPRASLLQVLHGADGARLEGGLEVRISRMRALLRQIGAPASQSLIRNVYGRGYVFAGTVVPEIGSEPVGENPLTI